MMPVVGGLEFLKKRRGYPKLASIPVVVLTGSVLHSSLEEAERLGAFACLRKPFNIALLVSTIDSALASRPRRELDLPPQPGLNPTGPLSALVGA